MSKLRLLLLALLLPALVLPDGMTVCLRRLAGHVPESPGSPGLVGKSCCTRCGSGDDSSPDQPAVRDADVCASCCVAVPETDRSLEPSSRKCGDDVLAPLLVLAPPPCFGEDAIAPLAAPAAARPERGPPIRSAVPISLPLRL